MQHVQLTRPLGSTECAERNALTIKPVHLMLPVGSIGIVVDQLSDGYLVEFGTSGSDECDWLGVLYPSEIELAVDGAKAA